MDKLRFFELSEFDSPDEPGSGINMDKVFLAKIEQARALANIPFVITSGYRTKKHNNKVGGKPNSAHLRGLAADIACHTSAERHTIVKALLQVGFKRVGVANNFIHADNDHSLPTPALFLY